jgi:predicted DNA-binding transcriptional regulator AlpA
MNARHGSEVAPGAAMVDLHAMLQVMGYSRTTAYEAIADQRLPKPVKVGRANRWPESELLQVRAAMLRSDDKPAVRALVRKLHAERGGIVLRLVRR